MAVPTIESWLNPPQKAATAAAFRTQLADLLANLDSRVAQVRSLREFLDALRSLDSATA